MRVLLVNKYYYLRSGTERYLFNLQRLLQQHGHQVAVFAMQHPLNQPCDSAHHFAPQVDFHQPGMGRQLQAIPRVIWYPEAGRRMARLLDEFRPDVVHLLNIYHHLSPAILPPISKRGIPAVQTLNDYKLICPNYLLFTQRQACMRCRDHRYWHAIRWRCSHGSLAWSALAAFEMSVHKAWRIYERHVRTFIAPSQFVLRTSMEFGIPAGQIAHLPYFLDPAGFTPQPGDGEYLAYFGRLSAEKGLPSLLRAMRHIPQAQLLLAGEGPARADLEALIERLGLGNVRLLGYLGGKALDDFLGRARATVLPAIWPEVFGQSVLESFAVAKPVIAARSGGIPELVSEGDGGDGLLFSPGDERACSSRLEELWRQPARARQMGLNGLSKVLHEYTAEEHYQHLLALYQT